MHPIPLAAGMHDQQIAISKGQRFPVGGVQPVSQAEIASGSQRQGCDGKAVVNFGLIVGMPAHAVVSVAVEIEKATVEVGITGADHPPEQRLEPARPAITAMEGAAVAVVETFCTKKLCQAWYRMPTSEHLNNRLLPMDLAG